MSSDGLSTLEPLTARVAGWRRRHRAISQDVKTYQVVFDGAIVATLEARTSAALDDELAAAAWELAQGLSRAATVDLVALDTSGEELGRLPLRILPSAPTSTDGSSQVIRDLMAQNRETMRLCVEMVSAVTKQMQVVSEVTTELARAMGQRALRAETDAVAAVSTVQDALSVARDAGQSPRTERALSLVEDFIRLKAGLPGISE